MKTGERGDGASTRLDTALAGSARVCSASKPNPRSAGAE